MCCEEIFSAIPLAGKDDLFFCLADHEKGEATAGESVLATPLWGMLYADDAGVVSRSPEQLRKMMEVIVVVCAAFGLTVSEAQD